MSTVVQLRQTAKVRVPALTDTAIAVFSLQGRQS